MRAEPGWLLPPPGPSAAPLLSTWQGSGTAVAAGRVQAAPCSCPLHKGTILGAPSHPHHGTSSSPAGGNLLGKGSGNRNCPGSSAKGPGGRGLPPVGLEGAASISPLWWCPCWGTQQGTGTRPSTVWLLQVAPGDRRALFVCSRELLWLCLSHRHLPAGLPQGLGCHWVLSPPVWGIPGALSVLFSVRSPVPAGRAAKGPARANRKDLFVPGFYFSYKQWL